METRPPTRSAVARQGQLTNKIGQRTRWSSLDPHFLFHSVAVAVTVAVLALALPRRASSALQVKRVRFYTYKTDRKKQNSRFTGSSISPCPIFACCCEVTGSSVSSGDISTHTHMSTNTFTHTHTHIHTYTHTHTTQKLRWQKINKI